MKRALLILCVLLTLLGLTVAGFGFWCLKTGPGARWLLATTGDLADIEITTSRLEGSLLDGLEIKGLQITWEGGGIEVNDLTLSLSPGSAWSGTLAIEQLWIEGLVLRSDEEEPASAHATTESPTAALALAPTWLAVTVNHLQIRNFVTKSSTDPYEETVIADRIAGRYRLAGHRLVAETFSYHSPYVELDGAFDWELTRPHLVMTAQVHLPEASADPALFDTIEVPIDFPGHLEFEGDWNHYSGPIRFGIVNDTGDQVWLSALATGSWRGIRFEKLTGRYLGGELSGTLDLAWIDDFRMQGDLSANRIKPGVLVHGVTGETSFDVSGELLVPYDDQPLQAGLDMLLKQGRFRDHALQGRLITTWVDTQLVDLDADLSGEGTMLQARGTPAQRVDIACEIADLGAFHTAVSGQASALGWLRWDGGEMAGDMTAHGKNVAWQGTNVNGLAIHARREPGDSPMEIRLTGNGLSYGTSFLERFEGVVAGTPADHQLQLAVEDSLGHFEATATGRYRDSRWAGRLERLTGRDTPWGAWMMPSPAALVWEEGGVSIGTLQLTGDQGATLVVDVDDWNSPGRGEALLAWTGFDLAWLQQETTPIHLNGSSAGEIRYTMVAGRPLSLSGHLTAQGRAWQDSFEVDFETLELDLDWAQEGLRASGTARSVTGERLRMLATSAEPLQWHWPVAGLAATLEWQGFDLARLNRLLIDERLEGQSEGNASFAFSGETMTHVTAHMVAEGRLYQGVQELGPRNLTADLDWTGEGLHGRVDIIGAKGGRASLQLISEELPAPAWPESGQVDLQITGLSLAVLEPLLPEDFEAAGFFDAHARGSWNDQSTLALDGTMQLRDSRIGWSGEDGQVQLPLQNANAEWHWRGESLSGALTMQLADHGELKGTWRLPLPARIPTAFDPEGPLQATLEGRMQAIGILSAIGPWLIQDVRGETRLSLTLQGTWANPKPSGDITFTDGSAYLPVTGIQLEGINLAARLADNVLRLEQLEVHSGPGILNGRGELLFDKLALTGYRLQITGTNFQVVDFPELEVLCDPELTLSGNLDRLSLHGTVLIPLMTIKGGKGAPEVLPSRDVVITATEKSRQELDFATDVRVEVKLGDRVTVSAAGLETNLAGGVLVTLGQTGEVLARGEIQLESGVYKAYGTRLKIRQGILHYNGGPIINPALRIFAAREVGSVEAGVQITGTAEVPVVTLYSRPAMPERDILGYILMGRALRPDSLDSDILMMGAGSLLPTYGEGLSALGITEIDIQGLFTGVGGVRLRRHFAENWEIESTLGVESGVDLFYIFEFE